MSSPKLHASHLSLNTEWFPLAESKKTPALNRVYKMLKIWGSILHCLTYILNDSGRHMINLQNLCWMLNDIKLYETKSLTVYFVNFSGLFNIYILYIGEGKKTNYLSIKWNKVSLLFISLVNLLLYLLFILFSKVSLVWHGSLSLDTRKRTEWYNIVVGTSDIKAVKCFSVLKYQTSCSILYRTIYKK